MNALSLFAATKGEIEKVESVVISIDGWSPVVENQTVDMCFADGNPAIYLGEKDNWFYAAPLHTMKAEKFCEEDISIYNDDGCEYEVEVDELFKLISEASNEQ